MGYDLSQINGSAFWSGGMATMGRIRDDLQAINALAPEYGFQSESDAFLDEMEKRAPKPDSVHFTRKHREAKTAAARIFRAELYEGMTRIKSSRHAGDTRPPVNKFIGNAGWIVTAVECETLLGTPGFYDLDDKSFVAFVEDCRETGFTVD